MYVTYDGDPLNLSAGQAEARGQLQWQPLARDERVPSEVPGVRGLAALGRKPTPCFSCTSRQQFYGLGADPAPDAAPPEAPTLPPVEQVTKHDPIYRTGMIIAGVTALVTIGLFALTLTLKRPE